MSLTSFHRPPNQHTLNIEGEVLEDHNDLLLKVTKNA